MASGTRSSEPSARTDGIPEAVRRMLHERAWVGHVATTSRDGEPHVAPTWFRVHRDRVLALVEDDSHPARDLGDTGRYALVVDTLEAPYRGVVISGRGELLPRDAVDETELVMAAATAYLGEDAGTAHGRRMIAEDRYRVVSLAVERCAQWDLTDDMPERGTAGGRP